MDPWLTLVAAGVFEVGFTTCLKLEERSKWFIVPFLICAAISFTLLSDAMRTIPLGTAYAVWTGIGAVGTVIIGAAAFGDPLGPVRVLLLAVLVAAMIGLKLVGNRPSRSTRDRMPSGQLEG